MHESIVTTRFGTVSPDWVTLANRGETIPLRHITGVTQDTIDHAIVGIFVALFGGIAFVGGIYYQSIPQIILALALIGFGVFLCLPRPRITLHVSDGRKRVQKGAVGTVDEAARFVAAVRAHLFALTQPR